MDAWQPFSDYHLAGRPVVVDDTQTDERVPPAMRAGYAAIAVGADLAVAVAINGRMHAVLAVNQRRPRSWTRDEVALVQHVAERCWTAVERALAETALREREATHALLLAFSDALRVEPSAEAVAERAIMMLRDHMRLDRCYITFYRPDEDAADFPFQVGNDSVPPLPAMVRLSDFPDAYEQVRERTFVLEDDFERRGLSEAEKANSKDLGMRAMLASTARGRGKAPLSSFVAVSARPRR